MTIEEYFGDWATVVPLSEVNKIVRKVNLLSRQSVVCPQIKDIFRAFTCCPYHNLKVVILAQDPYPNLLRISQNGILIKAPVATGIAFANSPDTPTNHLSPSLSVIKESVIDFTRHHGCINFDPSLEKWERQGVLMLNTALTCEAGKPGSHSLLWRPFMRELLTNLSLQVPGIVYVLMGTQAQSFEPYIKKNFNYIIHCRHPAWYVRNKTNMPSEIWKHINSILESQSGKGIEWFEELELSNAEP